MGGFAERAAPAGVFWAGVKYGVLGAAGLLKDMAGKFLGIARRNGHNGHEISRNKREGSKRH